MRLVLVSFAVMALVFYEMSGGSDFQPPEAPQNALASAAPTARAVKVSVDTPASEAPARITPAALVTKPAAPKRVETAAIEAPSAELKQVRASLTQGLTLASASTQPASLSLVSLELGAAGLRTATAETENDSGATAQLASLTQPEADLREIIGTRVNMRDGPGTIYPVVTRLNIGHKVEVLSDSGTGWLRLRTLPDQQLGWISASLVSK